MKYIDKHSLALTLAMLILSGTVVGCGSDDKIKESSVTSGSESSTAQLGIIPEDLNGYVFTVLNEKNRATDVDPESQNGETLSDAIYNRNRNIEDSFNVVIKSIASEGDMLGEIRSTVASDEDAYTLIMGDLFTVEATLALEGMLYDWNAIKSIDLTKPYYNQSIQTELSVNGQLWFMAGDMYHYTYGMTGSLAFNKELMNNVVGENIYDVVKSGEWTLDKFIYMCKKVSEDLDGNTTYDWRDRYGLLGSANNANCLYYSCGERIAVKDKDDKIVLTMNNERGATMLEKVQTNFKSDQNWFAVANKISISGAPTSDIWAVAQSMFIEDKGLFRSSLVGELDAYRKMDTDFGIVPYPKYDDNQQNYYTPVHVKTLTMSMPISVKDSESAGKIIEALSYDSTKTVMPVYYENLLLGKVARDNESQEMLNIIFSNCIWDIGRVFNVGGLQKFVTDSFDVVDWNFASEYAKIEAIAKNDVNTLNNMLGN